MTKIHHSCVYVAAPLQSLVAELLVDIKLSHVASNSTNKQLKTSKLQFLWEWKKFQENGVKPTSKHTQVYEVNLTKATDNIKVNKNWLILWSCKKSIDNINKHQFTDYQQTSTHNYNQTS